LIKFKDEMDKHLNFGENAQSNAPPRGIRLAEYNTGLDTSYGKKALDPSAKRRLALHEKYAADLDPIKHVYIYGEPGSGKSYMTELFFDSLDIGERKKRLHYNEFMLMMHEMEHKVN